MTSLTHEGEEIARQTQANFADLCIELTRSDIDVAGESQLVGYPTQFPSVSLVDWNMGQPNARYRVGAEAASLQLWPGRQAEQGRRGQAV